MLPPSPQPRANRLAPTYEQRVCSALSHLRPRSQPPPRLVRRCVRINGVVQRQRPGAGVLVVPPSDVEEAFGGLEPQGRDAQHEHGDDGARVLAWKGRGKRNER